MNRWLLLATALLIMITATTTRSVAQKAPPLTAPNDWNLTFSEGFATLDRARWATTFPKGDRHLGHEEKELYVDSEYAGLGLNPFSIITPIEGGGHALAIRADRADSRLLPQLQGQTFTSGMITTYPSFAQLYGYFEIRAQFPLGRGFWPAFWLMATDGSWPPEIDVVENLGHDPTAIYTTIYAGAARKPDKIGFKSTVANVTTSFHDYGVVWTPTYVAWYFDGKRIAWTRTLALRKPMYMLINLAVGGVWPGQPDHSTKFPATMQIASVRAYALPDK